MILVSFSPHAEWWTVQYSSQWTGLSSSTATESGETIKCWNPMQSKDFAIQCYAMEYNNTMQNTVFWSETQCFWPPGDLFSQCNTVNNNKN